MSGTWFPTASYDPNGGIILTVSRVCPQSISEGSRQSPQAKALPCHKRRKQQGTRSGACSNFSPFCLHSPEFYDMPHYFCPSPQYRTLLNHIELPWSTWGSIPCPDCRYFHRTSPKICIALSATHSLRSLPAPDAQVLALTSLLLSPYPLLVQTSVPDPRGSLLRSNIAH